MSEFDNITNYKNKNYEKLASSDALGKKIDNDGNCIIHLIAKNLDIDCIKSMYNANSQNVCRFIDNYNNNGDTPLHLAYKDNENSEAKTKFMDYIIFVVGARADMTDKNGQSIKINEDYINYNRNKNNYELENLSVNELIKLRKMLELEKKSDHNYIKPKEMSYRVNDNLVKIISQRYGKSNRSYKDDEVLPTINGGNDTEDTEDTDVEETYTNTATETESENESENESEGKVDFNVGSSMFANTDTDTDTNMESWNDKKNINGYDRSKIRGKYFYGSDQMHKNTSSEEETFFKAMNKQSRPRNVDNDNKYKELLEKIKELLSVDDEKARQLRFAIKLSIVDSKPEYKSRKFDTEKIAEMEKIVNDKKKLKEISTDKKLLEKAKDILDNAKKEQEQRKASGTTTNTKHTKQVPLKTTTKSKSTSKKSKGTNDASTEENKKYGKKHRDYSEYFESDNLRSDERIY
jgi:hypothetical protein